jgi:hypothetical protein
MDAEYAAYSLGNSRNGFTRIITVLGRSKAPPVASLRPRAESSLCCRRQGTSPSGLEVPAQVIVLVTGNPPGSHCGREPFG